MINDESVTLAAGKGFVGKNVHGLMVKMFQLNHMLLKPMRIVISRQKKGIYAVKTCPNHILLIYFASNIRKRQKWTK